MTLDNTCGYGWLKSSLIYRHGGDVNNWEVLGLKICCQKLACNSKICRISSLEMFLLLPSLPASGLSSIHSFIHSPTLPREDSRRSCHVIPVNYWNHLPWIIQQQKMDEHMRDSIVDLKTSSVPAAPVLMLLMKNFSRLLISGLIWIWKYQTKWVWLLEPSQTRPSCHIQCWSTIIPPWPHAVHKLSR